MSGTIQNYRSKYETSVEGVEVAFVADFYRGRAAGESPAEGPDFNMSKAWLQFTDINGANNSVEIPVKGDMENDALIQVLKEVGE